MPRRSRAVGIKEILSKRVAKTPTVAYGRGASNALASDLWTASETYKADARDLGRPGEVALTKTLFVAQILPVAPYEDGHGQRPEPSQLTNLPLPREPKLATNGLGLHGYCAI